MKNLFILLLLFISFGTIAQQVSQEKPKKIKIISSEIIEKNPVIYSGNTFLSGKVQLEHDKAFIFADTILINEIENKIEARSNVKIIMQDGTTLTSKNAEYNGNTKKAIAKEKVILIDKEKKIETEELFYDRNTNQAYFNTGGIITTDKQRIETQELIYDKNINQAYFTNWGTITDLNTGDVITSKSGRYFIGENKMDFDTSLKMNSKDYIIDSQKMIMNNQQNRADFFGPTTIYDRKNHKNYVYTENGYYYTQKKESFLKKNSRIHYNNKVLLGDDLYYNSLTGFGKGKGNVTLEDPEEKRTLKGGYGEIFRDKDSAMITQKPYGIKALKKDSLYFSADTLIAFQKKNINSNDNKDKSSFIYGYKKVRIFKNDLQGRSDSLSFNETTGKLEFYEKPIFWSGDYQIKSDTVFAYMNTKTEKIDSIQFFQNAFAIAKVDSLNEKEFNQIKGKYITVYLNNENKLEKAFVRNNSQSISYVDEENKQTKIKKRIGINRSDCGIIIAEIKNQELEILSCKINGDSKLYPQEKVPENEKFLPNFEWNIKQRLRTWKDIFLYDPE